MLEFRLGSGETVVDRPKSHVKENVKPLLPEVLSRVDSFNRGFFIAEVDFGEVIGETYCVITTSDDVIFYAQRQGRRGYSRFVLDRKPEPRNIVTVTLLKKDDGDGGYILITAYIGHKAEPEPWDKKATTASVPFWKKHALIPEGGQFILETVTLECPWGECLS